jgi:hypothetical protein
MRDKHRRQERFDVRCVGTSTTIKTTVLARKSAYVGSAVAVGKEEEAFNAGQD